MYEIQVKTYFLSKKHCDSNSPQENDSSLKKGRAKTWNRYQTLLPVFYKTGRPKLKVNSNL